MQNSSTKKQFIKKSADDDFQMDKGKTTKREKVQNLQT